MIYKVYTTHLHYQETQKKKRKKISELSGIF